MYTASYHNVHSAYAPVGTSQDCFRININIPVPSNILQNMMDHTINIDNGSLYNESLTNHKKIIAKNRGSDAAVIFQIKEIEIFATAKQGNMHK